MFETGVRDKKNPTSWLKYTKQRHKVKKIIRNDLKEEQNTVAQQYKTNPKNFGNTSILKLNTLKNRRFKEER